MELISYYNKHMLFFSHMDTHKSPHMSTMPLLKYVGPEPPANPSIGDMYFNSNDYYIYEGSNWINVSAPQTVTTDHTTPYSQLRR